MEATVNDQAAPPRPGAGIGPALVLATLSGGAGVLHLVMAPVHAGSSAVEAAGFALAGWLQLALAAILLLRGVGSRAAGDDRVLLGATAVANLVFIAVWALSRTAGLPIGAHAGVAEPAGAVDLVTVALEAGCVLLAALLWWRPGVLAGLGGEAMVVAAGVSVATLVAVTLVVVSPTTAQHAHGDAAAGPSAAQQQADFEAGRCDKAFNPRSYWTEAVKAGVDTGSAPVTATAAAPSGHAHGTGAMAGMDHGDTAPAAPTAPAATDPLEGRGSAKLDKVVAKLSSDSEADAAQVVAALADFDDREYDAFLYQLRKRSTGHSAAHSATGDDTGGHGGHMGPTGWVAMTDKAQCDTLARELDLARATALKYPTAADAEAGGWRKVTPYVPGIAAHYMNFKHLDGTFEVDKPEMLLYDGEGADARVVGLSYYVMQPGDSEPTQGFTGDNDHSHRHIGLCSKDGVVIGPSTMTEAECAAEGGRKTGGAAGWMSHAWVVPGCESPWGVFSGASPILDTELSKQSGQNAGGCSASKARKRYDLAPGEATPEPAAGQTESAAGR